MTKWMHLSTFVEQCILMQYTNNRTFTSCKDNTNSSNIKIVDASNINITTSFKNEYNIVTKNTPICTTVKQI
jgi:hypothetical protein